MFSTNSLSSLRNLIESLKRYNRYELRDDNRKSILKEVYVDPLPDDGVLKLALNDNTCFVTGRKGTGKSTIFLMAQEQLRTSKDKLAVYIDVKTVYGQSVLSKLELRKYTEALGEDAVDTLHTYLLHKAFITQFLSETINEMTNHLTLGLKERLFSDRVERVETAIAGLQKWKEQVLTSDTYRDIPLFVEAKVAEKGLTKRANEQVGTVEINGESSISLHQLAAKLGFGVKSKSSRSLTEEATHELYQEFKDILTLYFDVKSILSEIATLLQSAGFSNTYIYLDDFSEVEDEAAAKMIVDVLIAPLNNWSDNFFKLKIAAYPGRVYYGAIDKQKVDEICLDFYEMYASKKLSDLEQKATDFTRRMLERRTEVYLHHGLQEFVDPSLWPTFYDELFKATMNNPRRMGYILLFCYNSQIVHGQRITATAFREATIKYYTEKDESIFTDNVKIQQAFGERLMVQSQKELLQAIQDRSKELSRTLRREGSEFFRRLRIAFTSHFFILREFEFLLATLEHNFLVTKYHEMKDRDGREVTVYSLNYGLCQREGIPFGRPEKTEEGKYFTERAFNYLPTIQQFLQKFVVIECNECKKIHPTNQLQALRLFDMLCPNCRKGRCELSLGYKALVEEINARYHNIQLPEDEFSIVKVIHDSPDYDWYPSTIGTEVDRSYQFVTPHADRLVGLGILWKERKMVGEQMRNVYRLTDEAVERYFTGKFGD